MGNAPLLCEYVSYSNVFTNKKLGFTYNFVEYYYTAFLDKKRTKRLDSPNSWTVPRRITLKALGWFHYNEEKIQIYKGAYLGAVHKVWIETNHRFSIAIPPTGTSLIDASEEDISSFGLTISGLKYIGETASRLTRPGMPIKNARVMQYIAGYPYNGEISGILHYNPLGAAIGTNPNYGMVPLDIWKSWAPKD